MVGRPGKFQPRFTAGQLDQLMQANTDVDAFQKGAAQMVNVQPLPQGGFTLRDGLKKLDRVRGAPVAVAPNGGTALPLAAVAVAANTVVATYTFAAGAVFSYVDVLNFGGSLNGTAPTLAQPNPPESPLIAGTISVNYNSGAGWVALDQSFQFVDTLRTRRFALPAGQNLPITGLQVVINCTTAGGCYAWLQQISIWQDGGGPVAAKLAPNAYNAATAYDMVVTPQNIEVYSSNGRVASIPTGIAPAQVTTFKWVQQLATMILTHQAFAPTEIQRQGSDYEWQIQPAQFENIPNYDFGDVVYTNYTPSIWLLNFVNFDTQLGTNTPALPAGGAHVTISVNGEPCPALQMAPNSTGNWNANCSAIKAAILALPGVSAGITVVLSAFNQNSVLIFVEFGGSGNEGNGWAISGICVDKSDAAVTAAQTQIGIDGGEPIMSSSRGWPASCLLTQQRLLLGGFPNAPLSAVVSETGNPYQLSTLLTGATAPMQLTVDGQGNETIVSMHIGRTINIFTTLGEYWVTPGAISATSPPVITYSTSNGIAPTVDPIETEGVTVFTHASLGVLLEYYYEYQFQNYTAKPISVSASSLIKGVVDNALQRATTNTDTNRHYMVLSSGLGVLRATMRSEEINAFAQVQTDGLLQAVDVNARGQVNFVVQRQVNGAPVQFFERMVTGLWLDCAETAAVAAGQTTLNGLADYIGATVWAIVDGYTQGPFVVPAAGAITLEFAVLANGVAFVGRWIAPSVTTLKLPRDVGPRTVVQRPGRAHTVRLNLVATTNVAIGAQGAGPYDCPLYRFGGAADIPPSAQPFTGWAVTEGIPGFADDVQVQITQTRPGALTITGVTIEADL